MKRITQQQTTNPTFQSLYQKDEQELYSCSSIDYYALHYRRRIQTIIKAIEQTRPCRVLEIGSAQGNISLTCAERGLNCIALDINTQHLLYSKLKYEQGPMQWIGASADALPFSSQIFDVIVMGEILEHCAWPEKILQHAAETVKKNGHIIITTPNNRFIHGTEPPFSQVAHHRTTIEAHQFGPDGVDHLFTFTAKELAAIVAAAGLQVKKTAYIGSHFLHNRLTYHFRKRLPLLFNRLLEHIVPCIPVLRERYTSTLFMIVTKPSAL